ncbi:hypothetical protein [Pyrobaculum sp.]|uniref:hypothetical protein n=1 Tax=Pyrobaculum sp. TaxID=2004705 RepID=UPI0031638EB9
MASTYKSLIIFVILWIFLVTLTFFWTDFNDIVGLTATANVFLQGLDPYNFGGIYLPLAYGFVLFAELIFYPFFGNKIFYFYTFPNGILFNLMNQITLSTTIPLYSIVTVKILTITLWVVLSIIYIRNIIVLLKIYDIQVEQKTYKLIMLYYSFNPILFSSAVILVKPDELLAAVAYALLIYCLIRSSAEDLAKGYFILVAIIAILSTVPLISRLKTPFLPLVALAFLLSLRRQKSKILVPLYVLSAIAFLLPMVSLLMEWLYIMRVSGLVQALHPGFYTIYSIFRILPININEVALIFGKVFQNINIYILLIDFIFSSITSILVLKTHSIRDKFSFLINYILFSSTLYLLVVPNVLMQYLTSIVALVPMQWLLKRQKFLVYIRIFYFLELLTFASFLIYEFYNLTLGWMIWSHVANTFLAIPYEVVSAQIKFMNGGYWSTLNQIIFMPSYMAGFVLWVLPLYFAARFLISSLISIHRDIHMNKNNIKVDGQSINKTLNFNLIASVAIILAFCTIIGSYLFTIAVYILHSPLFFKVFKFIYVNDLKIPIQDVYTNEYYLLTVKFLPKAYIHVEAVNTPVRYGVFSLSLFVFEKYVDIPNMLLKYHITNSTKSPLKLYILYSDYYTNITSNVVKLLGENASVLIYGSFNLNINNCSVSVLPYDEVLPIQPWRSVITLPMNFSGHCDFTYRDRKFAIIKVPSQNRSLYIGVLATRTVLPVFAFGSKNVAEDVAFATTLMLSTMQNAPVNYCGIINFNNITLNNLTTLIENCNNTTETNFIILIQQVKWYEPYRYVVVIPINLTSRESR